METSKSIWHPVDNGLSVSGLNLWLIDRFAFETTYIAGYEEVQPWRKETAYGNLFWSAVEGWIKTQQQRGLARFLQQQYQEQVNEHGYGEEIAWWAKLAGFQAEQFVMTYDRDKKMPLSLVTKSERNCRVTIDLPSGRKITLNCYLDGEGDGLLMENKVRGKIDREAIAENIKYDLQYNLYLLALYNESGEVPTKVWYQTCLRPCGFGYGVRKKSKEDNDAFLERIKGYILMNPDAHFYRYVGRPTKAGLQKVCHAMLYPMLESFLDWYDYITDPERDSKVNRFQWMTPYGLYNPFTEEVKERFRNYRLTGSTAGLRKRFSK